MAKSPTLSKRFFGYFSRGVAPAKGFDAGKIGRRLRAIPTNSAAINTQIRQYGKNVLARSRYLSTNNPYAKAARVAYISYLVGTGVKPSWLIKDPEVKAEVQEVWRDFTEECDADERSDLYGMQVTMAGEMFDAGEVFIRRRKRKASDGLLIPFQLQILPSEMLPLDANFQYAPTGNRVECGIEFNAIGKRVAFHFYKAHPGEQYAYGSGNVGTVRVPAEEVIHMFQPIRAGQIRGVPHTLASLVTLAMLDLYDDAELERKRTAALFAAFIVREGTEGEDHPLGVAGGPADAGAVAMEPGAMIDLLAGQDVRFAEPADVGGNYDVFQYRQLLRAAAGMGVPYMSMTGDLKQTSYGSMRGGMLDTKRGIEPVQHGVVIFQFCRVVANWFMTEAVLRGVVPITPLEYESKPREYKRIKWHTPRWDWIDPKKDREAEVIAVNNGFKSRDDVIEAEGYDPEEVDARIAAAKERAERLGLTFALPPGTSVEPNSESDSEDGSEEPF